MKKIVLDFKVIENVHPVSGFSLLRLSPLTDERLPEMLPGQFVQVRIDNSATTFLRRPISICDVDYNSNQLTLLVRAAGDGTKRLVDSKPGDILDMLLPLGNGFTLPKAGDVTAPLLIGGGVGAAPLMMLSKAFKRCGVMPTILIGARSADLVLLKDKFEAVGNLLITTDDGSEGEKGVVTDHSIFRKDSPAFDKIYCCGPAPMMKSVASKAKELGKECEVSLENMMACGMGACLCCVENTVRGNVCVCTEGPVFNIKELTW